MELSVRAAVTADAPAIAAVNIASWEAAYRGIVSDALLDRATLAERASRWRAMISSGAVQILVAEDDAGVVGYCSLECPSRDVDSDPRTAKIRAFYVAPASFRHGVGSALMARVLAELAPSAFDAVTLWVLTENPRARAFYARHGFTPDGSVSLWLDEAEQLRLRRRVDRPR
jgi:ribosomal protein S18 acetylase RimI-like enzyme